ncbi:MAG: hypothetical protein U1D06_02040, partial [Paracoccaceae bacterium]|nr:hypothetical protein [Paracoccaceae bacterium]
MELKQRISLATMLLAIGLGSGHLVQSRSARPQAQVGLDEQPKPIEITPLASGPLDPVIALPRPVQNAPVLRSDAMLPAAELPVTQKIPTDNAATGAETAPMQDHETAALNCTVQFDLIPQPAAMLALTLLAPCHPDQRVVLRHAGLAVTAKTSATGSLFVSMPAMEKKATVKVLFADGASALAQIEVPDMASYR